jgi:hypothetical protein
LKARVNEITAEMGVVSSRRVLNEADRFRLLIADPRSAERIAAAHSLDELVDAWDDFSTPQRRRVLRAMRRDVLPWRLWREWNPPALEDEP